MRDPARVGRQRKGVEESYEEEAENWDAVDDDEEEQQQQQQRAGEKRKVRFASGEDDDDDDIGGGGARQRRGRGPLSAADEIEDEMSGDAAEEEAAAGKKEEDEGADENDVGEEDLDQDEEQENRQYEKESGFTIEPFNMREEREEGYIIKKDKSGLCYVEAPKKQIVDGWLEEYDEKWSKDIAKKERERKKQQQQEGGDKKRARLEGGAKKGKGKKKIDSLDDDEDDENNNNNNNDDDASNEDEDEDMTGDGPEDPRTVEELKHELVDILQAKETVTQALRRLKSASQGNRGSDEMKTLDRLTDLADKLLSRGYHGVYSDRRENMQLSISKWEYTVSEDGSGDTFGPFAFQQIVTWAKQGMFESAPISLRRVGDQEFTRVHGGGEILNFATAPRE